MNTIHREPNSQEKVEKKYVDQLGNFALTYIHQQYEDPAHPDMLLEYHNCPHTFDVENRVVRFLQIVAPQYIEEGRALAFGHDLHQEWRNISTLTGVKKHRAIGTNEIVSADMLVTYMRAVNHKQGIVFPEAVIARVHPGITVTIPEYDVQSGTVLQPNLTPESHIASVGLALADLGGAAMNGGAYFIEEGNRNFREMNTDITDMVRLHGFELSKYLPSRVQEAALRERFLDDSAAQVRFAQGRLSVLPYELSCVPAEHRAAVLQLMGNLPEAVQAARAVMDVRSVMHLDELVYDVYRTSPYVGG